MYPSGHARNTAADLPDILNHKFKMLGELAMGGAGGDDPSARAIVDRYSNIRKKSVPAIADIHNFHLTVRDRFE